MDEILTSSAVRLGEHVEFGELGGDPAHSLTEVEAGRDAG